MTTYKIGTRGSLLAVTQSTLIKNQLESMTGDKFELVLIKTQGDQITNKPLWQLEGKDFFTKELDEALLQGQVDFVIHSYKDLGSERPQGIKLAAITERRYAHDILLMPKENIAKLKNWQGPLIVGTSSPRRITNLTKSLVDFIPFAKKTGLTIDCHTLRGNVNSRIKKLREGQYHAITLALAGIERLAVGEGSRDELRGLLDGLDYFVLPQSIFPSSASQGALGIEMSATRDDGEKLSSLLEKLVHGRTVEEVCRERKIFKEFGGGCHLAVGIHVRKVGGYYLHVTAGEVDGKRIEERWLEGEERPDIKGKKIFIGLPRGEAQSTYDEYLLKKPLKTDLTAAFGRHLFVTSRYCIPSMETAKNVAGIWAAGTKTAKELASAGYWVNGTSDSLGTEDLLMMKSSSALKMFNSIESPWLVLSHPEATSDLGDVIGCYKREEAQVTNAWLEKLKAVEVCYWASYPQYDAYLKKFPFLKHAHHFCGLGKTWQEFCRNKVQVHPVASMQEFYQLNKE